VEAALLSNYHSPMRDKRDAQEGDFLKRFGNRLRALRETRGLTQEELSDEADFSRSYYSDIETGKRNISLLNLRRLAQSLHVSLNELLDVDIGDD
jgi:transcriptional regulator with XRE-family HTH domain